MVIDLTRALEDAVGRTLEGMLFMEAVPAYEETLDQSTDLFWASLAVKAPMKGKLTFVVPRSLLVNIVDGFYGEAGTEAAFLEGSNVQATDQIMLDTLAELLNTIAGRTLNLIVPANNVFELGLPATGLGYPDGPDGVACRREHVFKIDEQYFSIILEGENLVEFCELV
ncbi:MAG: hypothetical protein ACNI27_02850 [Desulfovibrio sp.]